MRIRKETIAVTTDASGDFTGYTAVVNGTLLSIQYLVDGTAPLATGADVVFTADETETAILTQANMGTASLSSQPRMQTHDHTDGSNVDIAVGHLFPAEIPIADERIKLVVTNGGDTKVGTFVVLIAGG
jgi:hypothetical protein